jgi:hypothetical protein
VPAKPETTFYQSIHRLLPKHIHREKMCNPFLAGTPDVWYSAPAADMWVEYKWIPKIPRSNAIAVGLTPRQRLWLDSRWNEGRNVAAILGSPDGAVIYTGGAWGAALNTEQVVSMLRTRHEVAAFITEVTCAGNTSLLTPPTWLAQHIALPPTSCCLAA